MKKDYIINSELFRDNDFLPLVLIDGGARGAIPEPFSRISSELLFSIRFEPDEAAEIKKSQNEIVFNKGLWSTTTSLKLNVARSAAASSIFSINIPVAEKFEHAVSLIPRQPISHVNVAVTTIDDTFLNNDFPKPDFLKLDIHGSEYEAIVGGKKQLDENILGVQVELWNFEIHKGQKTLFDIQKTLDDLGFQMIDIVPYAKWKREVDIQLHSKNEIMVFECFFVKKFDSLLSAQTNLKARALKLISILNLHGFNMMAYQLNTLCREKNIFDQKLFESIVSYMKAHYSLKHKKYYKLKDKIKKFVAEM